MVGGFDTRSCIVPQRTRPGPATKVHRCSHHSDVATANVDALRRGYEALNTGDLSVVHTLLHPDIEWQEDGSAPEAGVHRGLVANAELKGATPLMEFADDRAMTFTY